MEQYLIDTNIVSGYLTANISDKGMEFLDVIIDLKPKLSLITKIELLSWNTTQDVLSNIENFIIDSDVIYISDEIANSCIMLRKKKRIKIPDAIIASTAIVEKLTLITNNTKDFENIKGLKLINPYQL